MNKEEIIRRLDDILDTVVEVSDELNNYQNWTIDEIKDIITGVGRGRSMTRGLIGKVNDIYDLVYNLIKELENERT